MKRFFKKFLCVAMVAVSSFLVSGIAHAEKLHVKATLSATLKGLGTNLLLGDDCYGKDALLCFNGFPPIALNVTICDAHFPAICVGKGGNWSYTQDIYLEYDSEAKVIKSYSFLANYLGKVSSQHNPREGKLIGRLVCADAKRGVVKDYDCAVDLENVEKAGIHRNPFDHRDFFRQLREGKTPPKNKTRKQGRNARHSRPLGALARESEKARKEELKKAVALAPPNKKACK